MSLAWARRTSPVTLHRCKSNEDNNLCASGHQPISSCLGFGRNFSSGCVILKSLMVGHLTLLSEASAVGRRWKRMLDLTDRLEGPGLAIRVFLRKFCAATCFMWCGIHLDGALCAHPCSASSYKASFINAWNDLGWKGGSADLQASSALKAGLTSKSGQVAQGLAQSRLLKSPTVRSLLLLCLFHHGDLPAALAGVAGALVGTILTWWRFSRPHRSV